MAKYRVAFTETSYGAVILDLPDNASNEEIFNAAEEAYFNGQIDWHGGDYSITDVEKE